MKRQDVLDVELDEDYVPPHKQAGFVPYDMIIHLQPTPEVGADLWTEESITELLYAHDIDFDRVTGFREVGDRIEAFVSLEEF